MLKDPGRYWHIAWVLLHILIFYNIVCGGIIVFIHMFYKYFGLLGGINRLYLGHSMSAKRSLLAVGMVGTLRSSYQVIA